ncbi:MAG: lipoate--protein ligase family protein [Gammaproteobacteria bacterium]|nr:lipoate--protein ligase family protein [Gammaproteobacteria bacterium]
MTDYQNTWRVIDTGLRNAAQNMAMNKAMLEAHQAGLIPHTLRFLQFKPSALIGFHQSPDQELRTDYCAEQGIEVQRRITGGGAIYFDETQIGWELYLDKKFLGTANMEAIAARICQAAARGISALGVDARFRPRNDIEVDGRKISGTGGAFDGDSILYQGTLLIDFDVEKMLRVLRIPAEKLSDKAISSARERVANLKDLLGYTPNVDDVKKKMMTAFGEEFEVNFEEVNEMNEGEQEIYEEALREIDSLSWIYQHNRPITDTVQVQGLYKCSGGLMRASVAMDTSKGMIKQVWITGDFFVNPKRMITDLEAALKDSLISDLEKNVYAFFDRYPVEMLMLNRDDFVAVISEAVAQVREDELEPVV